MMLRNAPDVIASSLLYCPTLLDMDIGNRVVEPDPSCQESIHFEIVKDSNLI